MNITQQATQKTHELIDFCKTFKNDTHISNLIAYARNEATEFANAYARLTEQQRRVLAEQIVSNVKTNLH